MSPVQICRAYWVGSHIQLLFSINFPLSTFIKTQSEINSEGESLERDGQLLQMGSEKYSVFIWVNGFFIYLDFVNDND